MRIVNWNCNGKFREKFKHLDEFCADILVIEECEDPNKYIETDYYKFAKNYFWIGENPNKGLGIFAKRNIKIKKLHWKAYCLRYFLPICVNDTFNLLGVWTKKPYIEEFFIYQSINFSKINSNTIIVGDFNSNAIWNKEHGCRNHSAVVKLLEKKGLYSAYHFQSKEEHGNESCKTFFLHKNPNKGFHIDYCFLPKEKLESFKIFNNSWISLSDHLPIIIDIK